MDIQALILDIQPLTSEIVQGKERELKRVFKIGCKLAPYIGEREKGLMKQLAKAIGIGHKQLYEYAWMAREMGCDETELDHWCEEKRFHGKKPSIHGLRLHLKPHKHDEAYGGAEERKEVLLEQAEFAAERVEEASELGDVESTKDAVGLAIADLLVGNPLGWDVAVGFSWKNKHMLAHVAESVCPITGALEGEVHHLIPRARSGSDLFVAKLAKELHDEWHRLGAEGFAEKYNIDLRLQVYTNVTTLIDRLCARITKLEGPNWTL
jgi:hypothetical protein